MLLWWREAASGGSGRSPAWLALTLHACMLVTPALINLVPYLVYVRTNSLPVDKSLCCCLCQSAWHCVKLYECLIPYCKELTVNSLCHGDHGIILQGLRFHDRQAGVVCIWVVSTTMCRIVNAMARTRHDLCNNKLGPPVQCPLHCD